MTVQMREQVTVDELKQELSFRAEHKLQLCRAKLHGKVSATDEG